jgi:hypothetical protein
MKRSEAEHDDGDFYMAHWLVRAHTLLSTRKSKLTPGMQRRRRTMLTLLHAAEADNLPMPVVRETNQTLEILFENTTRPSLTLADDMLAIRRRNVEVSCLPVNSHATINNLRHVLIIKPDIPTTDHDEP